MQAKITRKISSFIFCLLFVVGWGVGTLSPIASAETHPLEEINNKYYAAKFLSTCFYELLSTKDTSIPLRNAKNYEIFSRVLVGESVTIGIGRYFEPNDGKASCHEAALVEKATKALGYLDIEAPMIAMGYYRDTCSSGGATYDCYKPNRPLKITGVITNKGVPQTDAAKFYAYKRVFESTCSRYYTASPSSNVSHEKVSAVQVVESPAGSGSYTTQTVDYYFSATEGPPDSNGYRPISGTANTPISNFDYDSQNTTCRDIVGLMNSLAPAMADYNTANPDTAVSSPSPGSQTTGNNPPDPESVCAAGAIGWLLCPLMTAFSEGIQLAAGIIGDFMQFEPLLGSSPSGAAIRDIWQKLVGVANLLMVVAFLVVIFSQATSIGLSAYGIKKMLPRIIAAAILINVSYYVCALLVDISNIIGASIAGIISSASSSITLNEGALGGTTLNGPQMIGGTALTLAAVVGAGALITGGVYFVVPVLLSALLSILFVVFVLGIRHIMAILLIIISPLAFAAMILPNTADMFKKWWKGLVTVLALYPIIMILAHGSLLVSKIILATAPNKAEDNFPIYVLTLSLALITQVAWIFALKFIVTWGSGLVGKIGGIINNPNKGLLDRSKRWSEKRGGEALQYRNDRKVDRMEARSRNADSGWRKSRAFAERFYTPTGRRIAREERNRQASEEAKLATAGLAASSVIDGRGGKYGEVGYKYDATSIARAQAVLGELSMKDAKIKLDFEFKGNALKAMNEALQSGDQSLMNVSAGALASSGKLNKVEDSMLRIANDTSLDLSVRNERISSMAKYVGDNHFDKIKAQDLGMMYALDDLTGKGSITAAQAAQNLSTAGNSYDERAGKSSAVSIAGQETFAIFRQAQGGHITAAKANEVLSNSEVQANVKDKQKENLQDIRDGRAPRHN